MLLFESKVLAVDNVDLGWCELPERHTLAPTLVGSELAADTSLRKDVKAPNDLRCVALEEKTSRGPRFQFGSCSMLTGLTNKENFSRQHCVFQRGGHHNLQNSVPE